MNRSNANARQHRNGKLRRHRHVDRYNIALLHAQTFKHIRKLTDFCMKLVVRQRPSISGFAFPDDGVSVSIAGIDISVKTVVADIGFAAVKPPDVDSVFL